MRIIALVSVVIAPEAVRAEDAVRSDLSRQMTKTSATVAVRPPAPAVEFLGRKKHETPLPASVRMRSSPLPIPTASIRSSSNA